MMRKEITVFRRALIAACSFTFLICFAASAADEPAQNAVKSASSFRAEAQENERTSERPDEVDGFWQIPNKQSWLKLSGFVMLDILHDFDAIGSETSFIPSTIPVPSGTKVDGSDGRTNYSFRQTRVSLDSRTVAGDGIIRAFVSVDFFGGSDDDPQLRMRQAFLGMEGLAGDGDLIIGQAWSFFVDTVALPETLDYENPAYSVFIRQGLVGWKKRFGSGINFLVSAEEPDSVIEGADGLTRLPDLVAAGRWDRDWGHLKLAALTRQLRASLNNGPTTTTTTLGMMFSGQILLGKRANRDNVSFQISAGDGVSRYLDDPPADAVYNTTTNELDTLSTIAGYASYRHWWSEILRTNVVYSALKVDNVATQVTTDMKSAQYSALNLIWTPYKNLDLGIEALYGTREDLDTQDGSATRLQLSGKYAF